MHCSTRQENSGPEINELEMLGDHRDRVSEDNDVAAKRIMKLRVFRKRFGEDLSTRNTRHFKQKTVTKIK